MVFNVQLNSSQSESMGCSNALTLFTNINKFSIDFCRQSICVVIQKLQKSNSIPLSNSARAEATTKIRFCLKLIPSAISYGGLLWHSNGIVIALVFKISMFSARVATCCRNNKDSHKQLVSQVKFTRLD